MGSRSGFDSDLELDELNNVVDRGSGAVTVATRQANVLTNLGLTVTQAELNALHNAALGAGQYVDETANSTDALTAAQNGKLFKLGKLAGTKITLPAATGSGVKYRFLVTLLATSNSHIIYTATANGVGGTQDLFNGLAFGTRVDSGNAVLGFPAVVASSHNTITLNRSTTGSVTVGEWINVEDVAAHIWKVEAFLTATGAAFATPFSNT